MFNCSFRYLQLPFSFPCHSRERNGKSLTWRNTGFVGEISWDGGILKPATGPSGYFTDWVLNFIYFYYFLGSLFDSYPYLFPCVINTVILLLAFVLTFFKFPETLVSLK